MKKCLFRYKDQEGMCELQARVQRPDIIEREVVTKSPPPRGDDHHPPLPHHPHDDSEQEHYDLDNTSSIAPSDIDIVYHYKGWCDKMFFNRKSKNNFDITKVKFKSI